MLQKRASLRSGLGLSFVSSECGSGCSVYLAVTTLSFRNVACDKSGIGTVARRCPLVLFELEQVLIVDV